MRFLRPPYAILLLLVLLGLCPLQAVLAQEGPPPHVRDAIDAVLALLGSRDEAALDAFLTAAVSPAADRAALRERLRALRADVHGPFDDVRVEAEPEGLRLILTTADAEHHLRLVLGPEGITDLQRLASPAPLHLTRDTLAETFDRLEADGMAGVVFVQIDGEVLLERAFGMAHEDLGIPNTLETVFGTGSRPIDYTVAAIHLLAQQGRIGLDDPITRYFEDVPADKQAITIRHLLTGRSGLPDFFHTADDWDPDLAWIDRATAERRLLAAPLRFPPGTDRQHSHAAFGLLAALVERVSGRPYYAFLREHFLDPAGMTRTGEYGETRGLTLADFAAGGGPQHVGLPNIPPNWGPTSWLIKGSGGMYSTLGDLRRFYAYVRSGAVLDEAHSAPFRGPMVQLDGSDRGFELFSLSRPPGTEVYLFVNRHIDRATTARVMRALERLAGTG